MHDIYKRAGVQDPKTYAVMTLINLGSYLACQKVGQTVYDLLHGDTDYSPDTSYFISPIAAHNFDVGFDRYANNVQASDSQNPMQKYLDRLPSYSEGYMNSVVTMTSAKIGYGTVMSKSKNPLVALAYGVSQPLAVLLEDAGQLK
jgi:hypothetical protein